MAMTWSGENLDIIRGTTAAALAPLARRPAVAWVANVIGFALLENGRRADPSSRDLELDAQPVSD